MLPTVTGLGWTRLPRCVTAFYARRVRCGGIGGSPNLVRTNERLPHPNSGGRSFAHAPRKARTSLIVSVSPRRGSAPRRCVVPWQASDAPAGRGRRVALSGSVPTPWRTLVPPRHIHGVAGPARHRGPWRWTRLVWSDRHCLGPRRRRSRIDLLTWGLVPSIAGAPSVDPPGRGLRPCFPTRVEMQGRSSCRLNDQLPAETRFVPCVLGGHPTPTPAPQAIEAGCLLTEPPSSATGSCNRGACACRKHLPRLTRTCHLRAYGQPVLGDADRCPRLLGWKAASSVDPPGRGCSPLPP